MGKDTAFGGFVEKMGGAPGLIGAGVGLASSIMSFADAKKQRELQVEAQLEADKAFEEAGRILQEQYMSGVSIPLGAYELEREGIAQAGAQAIQALTEGEARGAAGGVGRVVALQQEALAKQRADLEQRQFDLEKQKAEELMALQQGRLGLKMGELTGQQEYLADLRAQQAASSLAGVSALTDLSGSIIEKLTPLYNKKSGDSNTPEVKSGPLDI